MLSWVWCGSRRWAGAHSNLSHSRKLLPIPLFPPAKQSQRSFGLMGCCVHLTNEWPSSVAQMPSVIIVSNYFCLKRQHSSHCQGREINVFSEILWEHELFSCPQRIRNPDIAFLYAGHTWVGIPQRSIFPFVDSLLLWAVGRAFSSPLHSSTPGKCTTGSPTQAAFCGLGL